MTLKREAAESGRVFPDLGDEVLRHGVAGEGLEKRDDLLRLFPRRARVPDGERGEPIRVHVLGGLHELRESDKSVTGLRVAGARNLGEDGAVSLDDERRRCARGCCCVLYHGKRRNHDKEAPHSGSRVRPPASTRLSGRRRKSVD